MFPFFNTLPLHLNGNPSSAPQQQVMGNPGNFAPYTMQTQPQMGIINPQSATPFTNSSAQFGVNQFIPLQAPQNLNYPIAMNQLNSTLNNNPQPMPQIFAQNSAGPPKLFNQNLNLGFPNQLQDINQNFQLQMLQNFNAQAVLANLSLTQDLAFLASNRTANLSLPQNGGFIANSQLGFAGSGSIVPNSANLNTSSGTSNATQPLQGTASLVQGVSPIPRPPQNQKNFQQPLNFQGNHRNVMGTHMIRNNGKSPQNKNFKRNPKYEAPRSGFAKPQFQKRQNAKGNFNSRNMQLRRGNDSGGEQIPDMNSGVQAQVGKKRSLSLIYTEKEIQEWREERKKNYPSKLNIEKKLMEKRTKPEVSNTADKLRRQRLKEILAKQAELGCEVAEIPLHYLSDPQQQVSERNGSQRALIQKGKFQNKFNNKRGRFNQSDRKGFGNDDSSSAQSKSYHMAKKQRSEDDNSVTHRAMSKREPTLLQKLLSADVRRDRHHLLQVFRFMVMNSFFKDWPETPLKFPVVIVKETTNGDELVEVNAAKGKIDGTEGAIASDDGDDDNHDNENPNGLVQVLNSDPQTGSPGGEEPQEEEGEIVD